MIASQSQTAAETRIVAIAELSKVPEDEWNDLVGRAADCSVFQSYGWVKSWWESFADEGRKLSILAARRGSQLVGVAPLFVEEMGTERKRGVRLRFLGEEHADYLNFIVDATTPEVLDLLLQCLVAGEMAWDEFHLPEIPERTALGQRLAALVETGDAWLRALDRTPCPGIAIHDRDSEVHTILNKNSLKRHAAGLSRLGTLTVEHFDQSTDILPLLPAFFTQHIERWSVTSSPSLFERQANQDLYRRLVESLCRHQQVLFTVLRLNGRAIAYHFGLLSGDALLWYKPSFDIALFRHSPGEVLLRELVAAGLDRNYDELDFTRGDEAFKRRFCNHVDYNRGWIWYRRQRDLRKVERRAGVTASAKRMVRVFGLDTPVTACRRIWAQEGGKGGSAVRRGARVAQRLAGESLKWLVRRQSYDLYRVEKQQGPRVSAQFSIRPADLRFVLDYGRNRDGRARSCILQESFGRFKRNERCFVMFRNGVLVGTAWVTESSPLEIESIRAVVPFDPSTECFCELRMVGDRARAPAVGEMLDGIRGHLEGRTVLVYCDRGDVAMRAALASAGIHPHATVGRTTFLGGAYGWSQSVGNSPVTLKKLIKRALLCCEVTKNLLAWLSRKHCRIFMYHRFGENIGRGSVSGTVLAAQLDEISRAFNVLRLEDFCRQRHAGRVHWGKSCVITVDDGYRDFYRIAYPALRKRGLPATLFVATGFVKDRMWFWWDALQYLIEHTSLPATTVRCAGQSMTLDLSSPAMKLAAWDRVATRCATLPYPQQWDMIKKLEEAFDVPLTPEPSSEYAPCTVAELNEMSEHGITFGPHSVSHPILTVCADEDWRREIIQSRQELAAMTKGYVDVFAYPNGTWEDYNQEMVGFLKESGFEGAVIAHYDDFRNEDQFKLRRCEASADFEEFLWTLWGGEYVWSRTKELARTPFLCLVRFSRRSV